jgi:hypothetical protein
MTLQISNLQYANADNSVIGMTVTGWLDFPPLTFGYKADDTAPLTLAVKEILDQGGHTIAAYVAPPPVVPSVSASQAKIQLLRSGLLDSVKAAVAAADAETQLWFAEAATWHPDNAHVLALAAQLGITSQQKDSLFTSASAIV